MRAAAAAAVAPAHMKAGSAPPSKSAAVSSTSGGDGAGPVGRLTPAGARVLREKASRASAASTVQSGKAHDSGQQRRPQDDERVAETPAKLEATAVELVTTSRATDFVAAAERAVVAAAAASILLSPRQLSRPSSAHPFHTGMANGTMGSAGQQQHQHARCSGGRAADTHGGRSHPQFVMDKSKAQNQLIRQRVWAHVGEEYVMDDTEPSHAHLTTFRVALKASTLQLDMGQGRKAPSEPPQRKVVNSRRDASPQLPSDFRDWLANRQNALKTQLKTQLKT